jgi:hypothetical protein
MEFREGRSLAKGDGSARALMISESNPNSPAPHQATTNSGVTVPVGGAVLRATLGALDTGVLVVVHLPDGFENSDATLATPAPPVSSIATSPTLFSVSFVQPKVTFPISSTNDAVASKLYSPLMNTQGEQVLEIMERCITLCVWARRSLPHLALYLPLENNRDTTKRESSDI